MRGKVGHYRSWRSPPGITPAHAGKSPTIAITAPTIKDHPRACGEKSTTQSSPRTRVGSPPRMRGKDGNGIPFFVKTRITPAHAGKSQSSPYNAPCTGDHPRACGEKFIARNENTPVAGSPPRMRGKVIPTNVREGVTRITPAHAGKRVGLFFVQRSHTDHPRACGEKKLF